MQDYLVFLIQRRGIFYFEGQEKKTCYKAFKQIQVSPLTKHASFFSDVKNFCQDQMMNTQNNHWFALSLQDALIMMKSKHPIHIMMFKVVTSNGDVMPSFIFPHALRLNTEAYIKCLKEVVFWIKRMDAGRPYVWQQDPVPCHTSRRTQSWLSENFCNHITPNTWLPNSPDDNPLDYYVLDTVETNKRRTKLRAIPKMNWWQG